MTITAIIEATQAHAEQDKLTEDGYRSSLASLQAQVAAGGGSTAAPGPGTTFYGACPTNSGTTEQVVSKYGQRVAVRRFLGDLSSVTTRPAGVGRLHTSWKPALGDITSSAVANALKACVDGDGVEVWHEGDKKVRDGKLSRADLVAVKNKFWTTVDELRRAGTIKQVKVVQTLTGWEADPKNSATHGDINGWADIKAEILGLDFDGIAPSSTNYVDYFDEIGSAAEFIARNAGYEGWCVPEFGAPRHADDTDGSYRAKWFAKIGRAARVTGCYWVCQYDYTMALDYRLTAGSKELETWRKLVSGAVV